MSRLGGQYDACNSDYARYLLSSFCGYKVCNVWYMKRFFIIPLLLFFYSCTDGAEQPTPSPGVLDNTQQSNTSDSSGQITDSVVIKDTNTSDVEPMKKIN